jgi:MFS family permease
MLGLVKCFDEPALQGFLKDRVGLADLPNAIAWTNTFKAMGRMVGPALSGLVLNGLGVASGFLINAATFGLVVVTLANLRGAQLSPCTPVPRASGQIREGLRYVSREPVLAVTTFIMTLVFAAAYNFQIFLTLIASDTLAGNSETYGALMSAVGLGAAVGSLVTCALAAAQLAVAAMHSLVPLLVATFIYGMSAGPLQRNDDKYIATTNYR